MSKFFSLFLYKILDIHNNKLIKLFFSNNLIHGIYLLVNKIFGTRLSNIIFNKLKTCFTQKVVKALSLQMGNLHIKFYIKQDTYRKFSKYYNILEYIIFLCEILLKDIFSSKISTFIYIYIVWSIYMNINTDIIVILILHMVSYLAIIYIVKVNTNLRDNYPILYNAVLALYRIVFFITCFILLSYSFHTTYEIVWKYIYSLYRSSGPKWPDGTRGPDGPRGSGGPGGSGNQPPSGPSTHQIPTDDSEERRRRQEQIEILREKSAQRSEERRTTVRMFREINHDPGLSAAQLRIDRAKRCKEALIYYNDRTIFLEKQHIDCLNDISRFGNSFTEGNLPFLNRDLNNIEAGMRNVQSNAYAKWEELKSIIENR